MKSPFFISLLFALAGASSAQGANVWPGFRGTGDSHTLAQGLPWTWEARGAPSGNWTLRLPGYGQSSPVVWQKQAFVTAVSGDEKENLHVLAVAVEEGQLLWQRDFSGTQKVKDSDSVSRGAPTPVADDKLLFAAFESGDLFALTHAGDLVWRRSFVADYGEIKGPHGYASSPVLVDDLCVVQVAHSGPSYVLALDKATGEVRWKAEHPSQTGWSTPAVLRRGSQAWVILSTSGSVRALDAKTGALVWHFDEVTGNSTASPTIAGDYLVIGASADQMRGGRERPPSPSSTPSSARPAPAPPTGSLALKLHSSSPAGAPEVAWKSTKVSSGYASPLVLDGLAYFVNRVGVLQCVEVATGDVLWQHRLPGEVWASPVANHGHLTLFCKHGQVVTLKGGRELVEVAESQVSTTDVVYGVAAVDAAWLVRTGRTLLRISGSANTE